MYTTFFRVYRYIFPNIQVTFESSLSFLSYHIVGKFGEFGELSMICQTKPIQIIVLSINNLLAALLICQTFFCEYQFTKLSPAKLSSCMVPSKQQDYLQLHDIHMIGYLMQDIFSNLLLINILNMAISPILSYLCILSDSLFIPAYKSPGN